MKKLFVIILGILLISCSQEKLNLPSNNQAEKIKSDLISIAEQNPEVIDYRAARYLAYEELEGGAKAFLGLQSSDYTLSQIPRVVYDSNHLPEFYEFDIIDKSNTHTIVTIAKKTDNTVIFELFEGGKQSPDITTKSADDSDDIISEWDEYEALLSKMDEESLRMTAASIEQLKNHNELMEEDSLIDSEELASYWNSIEEKLGDLRSYESQDLCIPATKGGTIKPNEGDLYGVNPSSYYHIIPQYNTGLKATRWRVECGPGAVAWMYRGLYNSYPKNSSSYIPIFGDGTQSNTSTNYVIFNGYSYYDDKTNLIQADHGLYLQINKHTHSLGEMYEAGLKNAVSEITEGTYKVSTTAYSHKHIEKNEPVFVMAVRDGKAHYFVAFGYGYTKKGTKKTKYILIADNGVLTGHNTVNPYNAYWHKETSNYGLRYKVTKK